MHIVVLAALMIATYTDINKREIPIWLFPSLSVFFVITNISTISWINSLSGGIVGFVAFLFLAMFFYGGGGDILMMCSLGMIFGPIVLMHITMISSVLCIVYYSLKRVKTVPYAPFVLVSYIFYFVGGYFLWHQ